MFIVQNDNIFPLVYNKDDKLLTIVKQGFCFITFLNC